MVTQMLFQQFQPGFSWPLKKLINKNQPKTRKTNPTNRKRLIPIDHSLLIQPPFFPATTCEARRKTLAIRGQKFHTDDVNLSWIRTGALIGSPHNFAHLALQLLSVVMYKNRVVKIYLILPTDHQLMARIIRNVRHNGKYKNIHWLPGRMLLFFFQLNLFTYIIFAKIFRIFNFGGYIFGHFLSDFSQSSKKQFGHGPEIKIW